MLRSRDRSGWQVVLGLALLIGGWIGVVSGGIAFGHHYLDARFSPRSTERATTTKLAMHDTAYKAAYIPFVTENASASLRDGASATRYGRAEDVGVIPVVVAELKLRDVERQIFCDGAGRLDRFREE